MSAANHKELGGIVTAMKKAMNDMNAQHKALQAFHAKVDPSATKPGADDTSDTTSDDGKDTSGNGKSLNAPTPQGAGLPESNTTPLTGDDVNALIRAKMQAYRLAQRVGSNQ